MPTHILVPIKDIEARIKDLKSLGIYKDVFDDYKIQFFTNLLTHYKQISLDEKDMVPSIHTLNKYLKLRYDESDNPEHLATHSSEKDYKAGYKQALIDLVK